MAVDLNKNLVILLIIVVVFYTSCNCIIYNNNKYNMDDYNTDLEYGGETDYSDQNSIMDDNAIRLVKPPAANNAPISNTATRDLITSSIDIIIEDNNIDDQQTNMYLKKKQAECKLTKPVSLTNRRNMQDLSREERTPMPSY